MVSGKTNISTLDLQFLTIIHSFISTLYTRYFHNLFRKTNTLKIIAAQFNKYSKVNIRYLEDIGDKRVMSI